jgi:hypothetical protein
MSPAAAEPRTRIHSAVLRSEWTWFALLSAGVAVFYLLLRAPVLNDGTDLDPWIYTALMVNFDYLFDAFNWAYYTSRLPWIIPGLLAHRLFGPATAYFVLHGVFFFGAGLFAYLTIRRFFGRTVALAAYAVLMLSPQFYIAYANDYPVGALLLYLLGGVYFALTTGESRHRLLRAGASGFFFAAAAGTNLFAVVVIGSLLPLYLLVRVTSLRRARAAAGDAAGALAGGVLLLAGCGAFSRVHGGEFLFFMPSVRAASDIHGADYKAAGFRWTLAQPQLLVPAFVVLAVAAAYAGRRLVGGAGRPGRFALGAAVSLTTLYGLYIVWEFGFDGAMLEYWYYVCLLNVGVAFCIGAVLAFLGRRLRADGSRGGLFVAASAVSAALPVLLVYPLEIAPIGRDADLIVVALMAAVVLLLASVRAMRGRPPRMALAALALVGLGFTVNYAAAAGGGTSDVFGSRGTYAQRRAVLSVALQLVDFMRSNGLQRGAPAFWYDPSRDPNLNGIQSTYLWGDTWVGLNMPTIDRPMRALLEARRPHFIVLLCQTRSCRAGPAALRRAGYAPRPVAERLLSSGTERVWVRAFAIPKFKLPEQLSPAERYYVPGQAKLVPAPPRATRTWSLASGLPDGWTGSSAEAVRSARERPITTSAHQWAYELVSPDQDLSAGSYTIYLRGEVLAGGLDLGVLDVDANVWVSQRTYWSGQKGFDRAWMATPFTLDEPRKVRIVLSNWVPDARSSRWRLRELRLVHDG